MTQTPEGEEGVYLTPAGTYKAHVRLPNGRARTPTFRTRGEAAAWRQAALDAISHGLAVPDPSREEARRPMRYLTFAELSDLWLEYHYGGSAATPETVEKARSSLRTWVLPEFGTRRIGDIGPKDVHRFRKRVEEALTAPWAGKQMWLVWSALQMAWTEGWIDGNPASTGARRRDRRSVVRRRYISMEETMAITLSLRHEYRIAVWLQRACFLRVGEVYGLRLRDLDHHHRTLKVTNIGGKTGPSADDEGMLNRVKTLSSRRTVGIPDAVYDALLDYIDTYHASSGPEARLMVSLEGGVGSHSYIRAFRSAMTSLGFERDDKAETSHALRASGITDAFRLDLNPRWISVVAGHSVKGPLAGADITFTTYLLRSEDVTVEQKVAAAINHYLVSRVPDPLLGSDRPHGWVAVADVAAQLGVCSRTVADMVARGQLIGMTYRPTGHKALRSVVSEESLAAWSEAAADRVTLADAVEVLGMKQTTILHFLDALGHEVSRERIGAARAWMSRSAFEAVRAEVEAERAIARAHYSIMEAARLLQVNPKTVRRAILQGVLDEVEVPPRPWNHARPKRWLTKVSVDRAAATKNEWLRAGREKRTPQRQPGLLTAAEAAVRLGVSPQTVSSWLKKGWIRSVTMETQGGARRVWIPETAVEEARATRSQHRRPRSG